jgi:hypothetical protein
MKWKFWKSDEPLALPPEIVREVPKYICPNCSIEVRDEYCSHCGTKTVEKVCKIGHPVHLGDNFCPKRNDGVVAMTAQQFDENVRAKAEMLLRLDELPLKVVERWLTVERDGHALTALRLEWYNRTGVWYEGGEQP